MGSFTAGACIFYRATLATIPVNPIDMIDQAMARMTIRSQAQGIDLEVNYETPLPITIETDPTRLRQILVNLVGDATTFTEVGSVSISVRKRIESTPCLEFGIVDTGLGMTDSQQVGLFQPFTQADSSTSRNFGGTGRGLSICRRLANRMGGNVHIVRSQLGVGSCFRLSLPISATVPASSDGCKPAMQDDGETSAPADPSTSQVATDHSSLRG